MNELPTNALFEGLNPFKQYDRFRTFKSPSNGNKGNGYYNLASFTMNSNHASKKESQRGLQRLLFSFIAYTSESSSDMFSRFITVTIRLSDNNAPVVNIQSSVLTDTRVFASPDFDIRVYTKVNREIDGHDVELYIKNPYYYERIKIVPVIFDQIFDVTATMKPAISTQYPKYFNVKNFLSNFENSPVYSLSELESRMSEWTLTQEKIKPKDAIVTTYNGSTNPTLLRDSTILRCAVTTPSTLTTLIADETIYYGKEILLESWNSNVTLMSASKNELDSKTIDNHFILKDGKSRRLYKGEILKFAYIQNKWVEIVANTDHRETLPIYSEYTDGSLESFTLNYNTNVLRIASNGIVGTLKTIVPTFDLEYGSKIIVECWNDNTTLESVSFTSSTTNTLVLKGGTRKTSQGDIFELAYLQNKWVEL